MTPGAEPAAWAALILYVVGLVLAFGVRTVIHRHTTGARGFHGASGRPGSLAWWGGVLFVLALVLGVTGPVLAITGISVPPAVLARPAVAVLGLVVTLLGLAVVVLAQSGMGAAWRIGVDESERTDLVTDGLFRLVRNPIFTGMAAVAVGVVLLVPTVVTVLSLLCLMAAVQIQVRVIEEPYLDRTHGEQYRRYMAQAGRFLPRLSR
jgi:protein-S-isoprenylcysteine O-methyltransferase Ste14